MKKIKSVIKKTPNYIWYFTHLIILLILWLDFAVVGNFYEYVWLIGLLPIWFITYFTGITGSIVSCFYFGLLYGITEIIEYFTLEGKNFFIKIFSFSALLLITGSVVTAILCHLLKQKDIHLKEIYENVNMTIWSYDFQTRSMKISEGGVKKPFKNIKKDFEKDFINWLKYIHPDDKQEFIAAHAPEKLKKQVVLEYRILLPNEKKKVMWIEDKRSPIFNERGDLIKLYGFMFDITERKKTEQMLNEFAYRDSVTGLPNRYYFFNKLKQATFNSNKNGTSICLFMIDFDNFKKINDTLGHDVGDLLLQKVTGRIQSCLREEHLLSRQGGDEFLILMENVTKDEVEAIASTIIQSMNEPFLLMENEEFVTVSIGISFNKDNENNPQLLLRHADLAMYLAKERGKNNYQFYDKKLDEKIRRKTHLENALRKSTMRNEDFYLCFQPKVDLQTNTIKGLETLLRWKPAFGNIKPNEFIPILEETGLIVEVGEWVLLNACLQCRRWNDLGFNVTMAVNISARQLKEEGFDRQVKKALEISNLNPEYLELELTESIMFDVTESTEILRNIKKLGVKIAIDDFGIGFSSLNVVKNYDIDNLKIDQSFLYDVIKNENKKTEIILKSLIDIGKKLGTEVIVEGIETKEQEEFLKPLGVIGQGYYYSKPIPAKAMEQYLKEHYS